MTRTLLVVPTGRRVGLTSACLGLVAALDRSGVEVGFVKPIAQPRRTGADHSAGLVGLLTRLRPPDPLPAERAAALLGTGRLDELMEQVVALTEPLTDCDVVVVEGLVPSTEHIWSTRVNIALARALDADVLLVADGSTGVPDHDLAGAVAIAAAPYRSGELLPVAGCVVGRVPDPSAERVAGLAAALQQHAIPLAGAVPFRPDVTWPRVGDVVRELGARTLVAGDDSRRVAEVLVCAQAVPGLLPRLRDGALLLVPGDRHDVVMAAFLAVMNGVRLAGLLLTAGIGPDPEIMRLTAAATGLPVLLVDELTYPTAVRLHDMDPELSTDDPERARDAATTVADALDPDWLHRLAGPGRRHRLTPAAFRHHLVEAARRAAARIVLPEGAEPRTVRAAIACAERGVARCVLLTDRDALTTTLRGLGLALPDGVEVLDPAAVADRYTDRLVELRRHKGMTPAMAQERLGDPITVGTMMLAAGEVDGLVAGAVHTTAATVRPALELIRVAPARPPGVLGVLHAAARRGRGLRRLRDQPRPVRRGAGRHRRAERRQRGRTGHRAAHRDDQLQHRVVGRGRRRAEGDRGDRAGPRAPPGPRRRRPPAVRRGRGRLGGAEQAPGQPGRRAGHGVRLPRPEHRQHHLQGGAAQRRGGQHRPDAAGAGPAGERPEPRGAGRGHRVHHRAHRGAGERAAGRVLAAHCDRSATHPFRPSPQGRRPAGLPDPGPRHPAASRRPARSAPRRRNAGARSSSARCAFTCRHAATAVGGREPHRVSRPQRAPVPDERTPDMTDPDHPGPTEAPEALDRLEERVLGHRVDQRRDEDDDPDPPADDPSSGNDGSVDSGAGSEPSG
jgi:phosphate acetyltransferase